MPTINFINLTNGIQAIEDHRLTEYRFIRLQSTACEQKRWEEIILTISDDFLMCAALGYDCIVYDYGSNKNIPRAVWQGLEWLKYVLYCRWYSKEYSPKGRAKSSKTYFAEQYSKLSKKAKARLDYYKKFLAGPLSVSAITSSTDRDGDYEWYAELLK